MVIVLSNLEKRSFFGFLSLYLGSSFLLIITIAILYYNALASSKLEIQKDKMRTFGAELAFKAIQSHMSSRAFDFQNQSHYKIGMYSSKKDILFGEELEDIEFDKKNLYKK